MSIVREILDDGYGLDQDYEMELRAYLDELERDRRENFPEPDEFDDDLEAGEPEYDQACGSQFGAEWFEREVA